MNILFNINYLIFWINIIILYLDCKLIFEINFKKTMKNTIKDSFKSLK